MTGDRRFDQELPDLLAEIAPRTKPAYRDDIVRQTAHLRQRPAWRFPGRWLPASLTGSATFGAPPVRWKLVGIAALLLLALAVGLVLISGSQRRLPAPFGLAGNGVVAYEQDGDIYIADPVTGRANAIVSDTRMKLRPVFSDDGTRIVFEQKGASVFKTAVANNAYVQSPGRLVVARSDGTGQVVITPDPVVGLDLYLTAPAPYVFSPDSREVAFWEQAGSGGKLSIAQADGSGVRQLNLPFAVIAADYRPPDGTELVVTGSIDGGPNGIYAIDARTGIPRTIVAPTPGIGIDFVRVSPDGSRLAYVASLEFAAGPRGYQVHVVDIDGLHDVPLPMPPGARFQDAPSWSNDGRRLAITRGYASLNEDMALAVVPADGTGAGVESAHHLTGCCDTLLEWSPDDTTILVIPETQDQQGKQYLLLDPESGATATAPWTGTTPTAWQRVAP
jgi:hypothetical protein